MSGPFCVECQHRAIAVNVGLGDKKESEYPVCGRTGSSIDWERSASGSCGPEGVRFEKAEPQPYRGEMSDRPETSSEAYELKLDDGCAVIFLEGMSDKREAQAVARELTSSLHRQVDRRGQRFLVIAVPPSVRMRVIRGREIKMQATADNRVVMEIRDGRDEDGMIVIPKSW